MKGELKLYVMAKAMWPEIHFPRRIVKVDGYAPGGNPSINLCPL
jgi:hypothetical protein